MQTRKSGAALGRALALCLGVALIVGLLAACGGEEEPREHYSFGRVLEVYATEPAFPERSLIRAPASCDGNATFRLLEHTNPNRTYAAVQVRIVNRTAGVAPLFVHAETAVLGDPSSDRIFALDLCTAGVPYEPPPGSEAVETTHTPLLWGNVELKKGFQVRGWMFFDVPKTLALDAFWWEDPETQTIIYSRNLIAESTEGNILRDALTGVVGVVVIVAAVLVGGALYFLPTLIAIVRRKRNSMAIFLMNFFLGWTFIGWVVALVWSVSYEAVDLR